ncbi:hypothetical protein EDD11_004353 [Mortierella claussenii]|nr:hypothetical protein EDD11_004353 [Mortierella claussenii]
MVQAQFYLPGNITQLILLIFDIPASRYTECLTDSWNYLCQLEDRCPGTHGAISGTLCELAALNNSGDRVLVFNLNMFQVLF